MLKGLLRATAVVAAGAGAVLATNPNARSVAIRLLARSLSDPATRRGLAIATSISRGAWTELVLRADLSAALGAVAGRPLEAVAYTHFGGFGSRPFAALLDPTSPYYQAWLGAYAVFVDSGEPFGYDAEGRPVPEVAGQLLEADQRLVLDAAGLIPLEDPRPRVKLVGELAVDEVIAWGASWTRVRGVGETISAFQRGSTLAPWRARWLYGVVTADIDVAVRDFHPVTAHGTLWYRYDPALGATVAKFYVYAEYVDREGRPVARGKDLAGECEALMDGIRFDVQDV